MITKIGVKSTSRRVKHQSRIAATTMKTTRLRSRVLTARFSGFHIRAKVKTSRMSSKKGWMSRIWYWTFFLKLSISSISLLKEILRGLSSSSAHFGIFFFASFVYSFMTSCQLSFELSFDLFRKTLLRGLQFCSW